MMDKPPQQPDQAAAQTGQPAVAAAARPAGRPRRWLVRGLAGLLLGLLSLLALLAFLLASQSGSRLLLDGLQRASGGMLQLSGVQGNLWSGIELDQLQFNSQDVQLKADAVQLQWQLPALWRSQLAISRLHIGMLTVASRSSKEAARLPQTLALPVDIQAADLAVGVLQINTLQGQQQTPDLRLSALTGRLDYRNQQFFARLALRSDWGSARLDGQLAAIAPFALKATASLNGQVSQDVPVVSAELLASGSLSELVLQLQALDARSAARQKLLTGQARLVLLPFSPELLKQAQIDLQHIDPSAWSAAAPQADLTLKAWLQPQPGASTGPLTIAGSLQLDNLLAGSWDQNRLPLQALQTALQWRGQRWQLNQLKLTLNGDARIHGQLDAALTAAPTANAVLNVENLNLKALDRRLQASKIAGNLNLSTDAQKKIQLKADLHDAAASLQARAEYDSKRQQFSLNQFRLSAGAASMEGKGELSLRNQQAFALQAQLHNLDPARWLKLPAGSLHGELALSGNLQPALALKASLQKLSGQFGGQNLAGQADLAWHGGQGLTVSALDLHWGKNSLSGSGAWGRANDQLRLQLQAAELAALNPLLQVFDLQLDGQLQADLQLRGSLADPAAQVQLSGRQLDIRQGRQSWQIATLDGNAGIAKGNDGTVQADLALTRINGVLPKPNEAEVLGDMQAAKQGEHPAGQIDSLKLTLQGSRKNHRASLQLQLPKQRQFNLALDGALQPAGGRDPNWHWNGQLQSLTLSGKPGLTLSRPVALKLSPQYLQFDNLALSSELAQINVAQFEWNNGGLRSKGSMSGVRPVQLLNLVQQQYALTGDLSLGASWDLQMAERLQARVHVERQNGDLRFNDPDGTGVPVPLGVRQLSADLQAGGLLAGSDGDRMTLSLSANGSRLGSWQADASSSLSRSQGGWTLNPAAELAGKLSASVPDLEWLGPLINPGLVMKGRLQINAAVGGRLNQPQLRASASGRELELAFASEGLLLPNGSFDLHLDGSRLVLDQLQFSNTVKNLPRHDLFKDSELAGQTGQFKASGEVDIGKETGSIQAQWQHFPLVQRADRWLVVSGSAAISEASQIWTLNGNVLADGGYFRLPKLPPPSLSDDVHVIRNKAGNRNPATDSSQRKGLKTRLDFSFDMGPRFVFVGRGLNTGLAGKLRLRSVDGSPLQANGSISTVKGAYEGYGQQLAIERGILNFQGPPANPGLNIRALRQGLAVEAGVEVVGTVAAPQVRLVSEPDVPDAEKLSWLVLGRGSDQLAGGDASLLMSAASAIFGGDGSRNVPRDIVQGLGFDEFSIGAASSASASHVPGQTVAGATNLGGSSSTSSDQVVSVGKRLMPGLVLSVERGLSDASGAIKLSWQLTRRITIVGRTGSESAVDINYTFSFN